MHRTDRRSKSKTTISRNRTRASGQIKVQMVSYEKEWFASALMKSTACESVYKSWFVVYGPVQTKPNHIQKCNKLNWTIVVESRQNTQCQWTWKISSTQQGSNLLCLIIYIYLLLSVRGPVPGIKVGSSNANFWLAEFALFFNKYVINQACGQQ